MNVAVNIVFSLQTLNRRIKIEFAVDNRIFINKILTLIINFCSFIKRLIKFISDFKKN